MGFPAGMLLNTIAFGIPMTATGKDIVTTVTVKPTARVIWAATGQPLPEFSDSFTAEAGQLGQFQVPAIDQPGFIDSTGAAITDWAYQITASWSFGNERPITWSKNLKPLMAQSGIIDLDLVPDGPVSIPVTAPTAAVLGFGGRTGFVTLQESDLPSRLSDAALSATYAPVRAVDILSKGAVGDGVADDWVAFAAARTAAGTKGVVRFPAKPGATTTTYYFATATAGANPDLTGCQITTDPGVVISVNGCDYVTYRSLLLLTATTLYVRSRYSTVVLPPTANKAPTDPALSLAVGSVRDDLSVAALDFTTWQKRNYNPDAGFSGSTVGSTTTAQRLVTFTGTETTGTIEGVYYTGWRVGDEISVVFQPSSSNASAEAYAQVNASGESVIGVFPDGALHPSKNNYIRKRKTGTAALAVEKTIALPDTSYAPQGAAQATIAIRIVTLNRADFYVNGLKVDSITTTNPIEDIGFAVDCPYYSARISIKDPILKRRSSVFGGGKTLNVAVLGDSITYAEGSSVSWADYLIPMLRGQSGISDVVVTNLAQSGASAAGTNTVAQGQSFAGFDLALVMVGTNDIGAQTTQASYESTLGSIASKIVADGSKPVFGVPPMFTYEPVGGTSPVRPNYGKGELIRSSVHWFCATNGYQMADVRRGVGAVGIKTYPSTGVDVPTMYDGLHPNALGAVFIARAFGAAALRALAPTVLPSILTGERMDGAVHVDYGASAPIAGTWAVGDRRYNSAPAASGSIGWVCTTAGTPGTWKTFGTVGA